MTDEEYEVMFDLIDKVAEENNLHNSTWSLGHTNFQEQHPFGDVKTLIYFSDPFWGKPSGDFSESIEGNLWLDLWIAADKIMARCGDKHHYFIESFEFDLAGNLTMSNGS